MLKAAGLVTVVAVCTACGLRFSEALRMRQRKLTGFYIYIGEISDRIRIGEELSSVFESETAQNLIEKDGFSVRVLNDGLLPKDVKLLEDFFSGLGMGDAASQTARCETYRELVGKNEAEAETEVKAKARLYSLLGFFAGLFAATMLL